MRGEGLTSLGCLQLGIPDMRNPGWEHPGPHLWTFLPTIRRKPAVGQQARIPDTHPANENHTQARKRCVLPVRQSGVSKADGKSPGGHRSESATSKGELSFSKVKPFCLQTHCFCQREFFILGALGKLQSPRV